MWMKVKDYTTLQAAVERLSEYLIQKNSPHEKVFDCKLVAYELLGNVLKHGGGEGELRAEIQDDFVLLKVVAKQAFSLPEQIQCSDLLAESGRGLFLVNTLCDGNIHADQDGLVVKIKISK